MVTYQDLLLAGQDEKAKIDFVYSTIQKYKATEFYETAVTADQYDKRKNPDIKAVAKTMYSATGRKIADSYSSDYKVSRAFFPFFITQEVQYLLGNGVTWQDSKTPEKLGTPKRPFDTALQKAAHYALCGGCSYGFWNLDHLMVFSALEFCPLYDEENNSLRSGIRFWQIDEGKPFRATLYEEDGYTEYIWSKRDESGSTNSSGQVLVEKRPYIIKATSTEADSTVIYEAENYPAFPIVPFWGNKNHQSEIVGIREQIYVFDVIKSGFCNTVEDASYLFWAVSGAPGMDSEDLAQFMQRVKQLHIAITEDAGSKAAPTQIETPYQARETLLARLEKDIFKDAMAFDPETVASGAATATEINAAYTNLELKCTDFEYCVIDFVNSILELAGVDDKPTFTRSRNLNVQEEITTVLSAATVLDDEYLTKKVLTLLGDGDMAEEVIKRKIDDEVTRERDMASTTVEEGLDDGPGAQANGTDNSRDRTAVEG